jgi:D-galactarolactone isomerase
VTEFAPDRRTFLAAAGLTMLGACAPKSLVTSPFSAGQGAPRLRVPRNACDSHIHILDPRFPATPGWKGEPVNDATVSAYRAFQKRIGTSRVVVVTPSTYGDDNRATMDALAQFGASARGVIVINSDTPPSDLARMRDGGVKGIRVNFVSPQPWGQSDARRLVATARIAADMGWHIQIYAKAAQITELEGSIASLPVPVVIDHLGYVPPAEGVNHPGHLAILRLLANGRTWLKLSGAYISSVIGQPSYADLVPIAQSYAGAAPDRLVWGSDWPHRGQARKMPDDANLIDLLTTWLPDEEARKLVLVDNPAKLYGF